MADDGGAAVVIDPHHRGAAGGNEIDHILDLMIQPEAVICTIIFGLVAPRLKRRPTFLLAFIAILLDQLLGGFAVEWFGVQEVSGVIATVYFLAVTAFTFSPIIHQMDEPVVRFDSCMGRILRHAAVRRVGGAAE